MWPRSPLAPALAGALALCGCDRDAPAPAPSASAAAPAPAVTRAVITMDDAHDMMTVKAATPYTISPAAVLTLDGSQLSRKSTPDAVHVAHGAAGYYRGSFKGPRVELGAATLDPVRGREAFPGFEAGEKYVVAIGQEAPSKDGALRFTPVWTAEVIVK